eukprot:1189803-Prorocentrum_minimum.AAC.4
MAVTQPLHYLAHGALLVSRLILVVPCVRGVTRDRTCVNLVGYVANILDDSKDRNTKKNVQRARELHANWRRPSDDVAPGSGVFLGLGLG